MLTGGLDQNGFPVYPADPLSVSPDLQPLIFLVHYLQFGAVMESESTLRFVQRRLSDDRLLDDDNASPGKAIRIERSNETRAKTKSSQSAPQDIGSEFGLKGLTPLAQS